MLQTAGGEEIYFEETLSTFLESAGLVSIWVVRSGPADAEASVQWSVTGGSASPAGDFTPTDGVVNFEAGQTRREISLLIMQDALVEGDETLELSLHNPVGAELGTPAQSVVTILDDDQPHTPEADLSLFKEAEPDTAPVGQPIRLSSPCAPPDRTVPATWWCRS